MASQQPKNHRHPQHVQATSAASGCGNGCEQVARYTRKVPLNESDELAHSQEQVITTSGLEYAVFMKAYQLIEKHYGQLPEYRGLSQRFGDQARMVPSNCGRVTWTSFLFRPGQECSYMDALHEMTHLLATMMLDAREDRDAMRDILRLAYEVVNHQRTFEPLDQSHRLIMGKWEHLSDTLQGIC